jgi:hypothetical protein
MNLTHVMYVTELEKFNSNKMQKIYLGNLQDKIRDNGDSFSIGTICIESFLEAINVDVDVFMDMFREEIENCGSHVLTPRNGLHYLKIINNPYKNGPNKYGNTQSIAVDYYYS